MFKYLQELLHTLRRETSTTRTRSKSRNKGNGSYVNKGKTNIDLEILAPIGNERCDFENSKEFVKLKRTYSLLMKKFLNPNLDLTPASTKPLNQIIILNLVNKHDMLKYTINSMLEKKNYIRKLSHSPDKKDPEECVIPLTPEELIFGWSGQRLDQEAVIAKIEKSCYLKELVSYSELEEVSNTKQTTKLNKEVKINLINIIQRKQSNLFKYLNLDKPYNLAKKISKSHMFKFYDMRLSKQENLKELKLTEVTKDASTLQSEKIGSSYTESPEILEAKTIEREQNNDKLSDQNIPLITETANGLESSSKAYNKNNKVENIAQVNCKTMCPNSYYSETTHLNKEIIPQNNISSHNDIIDNCIHLIEMPQEATDQTTTNHKKINLPVLENSHLKCQQNLKQLIKNNHITEAILETAEIKIKPENNHKKNKEELIISFPSSLEQADEDINHYNPGDENLAQSVNLSTMNLPKTLEANINSNELEETLVKTTKNSFVADKPQPVHKTDTGKVKLNDENFMKNESEKNIIMNEQHLKCLNEDKDNMTENGGITANIELGDMKIHRRMENSKINEPNYNKSTKEQNINEDILINLRQPSETQNNNPKLDLRESKSKEKQRSLNSQIQNENTYGTMTSTRLKTPVQGFDVNASENKIKNSDVKIKIFSNDIKPKENRNKSQKNLKNIESEVYVAEETTNLNQIHKEENHFKICDKNTKKVIQDFKHEQDGDFHKNCGSVFGENKKKYHNQTHKSDSELVKCAPTKYKYNKKNLNQSKNRLGEHLKNNNLTEIKSPNAVNCSKQMMIVKSTDTIKYEDSSNASNMEIKEKHTLLKSTEYPDEILKDNKMLHTIDAQSNKHENFVDSNEMCKQNDQIATTKGNLLSRVFNQEQVVGKGKINEQLMPERENSFTNSQENSNLNHSKMSPQISKSSKGENLPASNLNHKHDEEIQLKRGSFSISEVKSLSNNSNKHILNVNPDSINRTTMVPKNTTDILSEHVSHDNITSNTMKSDQDSDNSRKLHSRKCQSPKVSLKKYGENKVLKNNNVCVLSNDLPESDICSLQAVQVVSKKGHNTSLLRKEDSSLLFKSTRFNQKSSPHQNNVIVPGNVHTRNSFTAENKANVALNYLWKRYASTLNRNKIIYVDVKRNIHIKSNHNTPRHTIRNAVNSGKINGEENNIELKYNIKQTNVQGKTLPNKKTKLLSSKESKYPFLLKQKKLNFDIKNKINSHNSITITMKNQELPSFSSSTSDNNKSKDEVCGITDSVFPGEKQREGSVEQFNLKPSSIGNSQIKIGHAGKLFSEGINKITENTREKNIPHQTKCVAISKKMFTDNNPILNNNMKVMISPKDKVNIKIQHSNTGNNQQQLLSPTVHNDKRKKFSGINKSLINNLLTKSQKVNGEYPNNIENKLASEKGVDRMDEKSNNSDYTETKSLSLQNINFKPDETILKNPTKWKSNNQRKKFLRADKITKLSNNKGYNPTKQITNIQFNHGIEKSKIIDDHFDNGTHTQQNSEQTRFNQIRNNQKEISSLALVNKDRKFNFADKQKANIPGKATNTDEQNINLQPTWIGNKSKATVTNTNSIRDDLPKIKVHGNGNTTKKSIYTHRTSNNVGSNSDKNFSIQKIKTPNAKVLLNITGRKINKKLLVKNNKLNLNTLNSTKKNDLKKIIDNLLEFNEKGIDSFDDPVKTKNPGPLLGSNISTTSNKTLNKKASEGKNNIQLKNKPGDNIINKNHPKIIMNSRSLSHILKPTVQPPEARTSSIDVSNTVSAKYMQNALLPKVMRREKESVNKMIDNNLNKKDIFFYRDLIESTQLTRSSKVGKKLNINNKINRPSQPNMLKDIVPSKDYGKFKEKKPSIIKKISISNFEKSLQKPLQNELYENGSIDVIIQDELKPHSLTLNDIKKLCRNVSSSGYKNLIQGNNVQNLPNTVINSTLRNVNDDKDALQIQTKPKLQPPKNDKYHIDLLFKINLPFQKFTNNYSTSANCHTSAVNSNVEKHKKENIHATKLKSVYSDHEKIYQLTSSRPGRSLSTI